MQIGVPRQIGGIFGHFFQIFFPAPFSLPFYMWAPNTCMLDYLILSHKSLRISSFKKNFPPHSLDSTVSTDLSSSDELFFYDFNLLLSTSNEVFIVDIVLYSFRISICSKVFISLQKFPICSFIITILSLNIAHIIAFKSLSANSNI